MKLSAVPRRPTLQPAAVEKDNISVAGGAQLHHGGAEDTEKEAKVKRKKAEQEIEPFAFFPAPPW